MGDERDDLKNRKPHGASSVTSANSISQTDEKSTLSEEKVSSKIRESRKISEEQNDKLNESITSLLERVKASGYGVTQEDVDTVLKAVKEGKLADTEFTDKQRTLLSIKDTPENAEAIRNLYDEVYNENHGEKQRDSESIRNDYERYRNLSNNRGDDNFDVKEQDANGRSREVHGGESASDGIGHSRKSTRDNGGLNESITSLLEPDIVRNGIEFDYVEELLSNPNNIELQIKRRQPARSATQEKHPNTSNKLPSDNSISQTDEKSTLSEEKVSSKIRESRKISEEQNDKLNESITSLLERVKASGYGVTQEDVDTVLKAVKEGKLADTEFTGKQRTLVKALETAGVEYIASESKKEATAIKERKKNFAQTFVERLESWDRKTIGFSFVMGETSEALQKAGIPKKEIRWDASKISTLLKKHNGMSIDIVKQVPKLLENPIVVIDSKKGENSKIVMGDLYDIHGNIVTAVLLLTPTSKKGTVLNLIKISSAEGRGHIKSLFTKDDGSAVPVRYIDKKRIQSWLDVNGLQLPLHNLDLDSNNSISQTEEKSTLSEQKNSSKIRESRKIAEEQNDKLNESITSLLERVKASGYGVTQEDVDTVLKAVKEGKLADTKFTDKQRTLVSEVIAMKMEETFSDARSVERLVNDNPSLAKRIWQRIKALVDSFGKSKEEKEQIKKLRQTEELFRKALENAGVEYIEGEVEKFATEGAKIRRMSVR